MGYPQSHPVTMYPSALAINHAITTHALPLGWVRLSTEVLESLSEVKVLSDEDLDLVADELEKRYQESYEAIGGMGGWNG
jgi:hypothetical protein